MELNEPIKASLARWERVRAKGKWRHLLLHAVGYGLAMFSLRAIFDLVWGNPLNTELGLMVIYFGFGCMIGLVSWLSNESKYRTALSKRNTAHDMSAPSNS